MVLLLICIGFGSGICAQLQPVSQVATSAAPNVQAQDSAVAMPQLPVVQPPMAVQPSAAPLVAQQPIQLLAPKPAASMPQMAMQPAAPAKPAMMPAHSTAVQGLPAMPMPAPASAPSRVPDSEQLEKEEPQGIDTMDMANAQGNWLFKRMWWQRAETQYEKIKAVVEVIMEARMAFFAKRTEWDKTIFDPFYLQAGLGRGILEELISSLISQLNQERVDEGQLDEKERYLLTSLESQKAVIEQLQKDVQKITDIDSAVDEAISVLIKQINVARNFEKQSWQNFKRIAQELDDKKARELYYGMVTYWQNINEVGQYVQQPFLQHFEKLGVLAKEQTEKVLSTLKALKEKGIDFKKQWQELEENNVRKNEARDYKEGIEEGKKEAEAKAAAEAGFFSGIITSITNGLSTSWDYMKSAGQTIWDWTFGRFFAKKTENVEPAKPVQPVVAVVSEVLPVIAPVALPEAHTIPEVPKQ